MTRSDMHPPTGGGEVRRIVIVGGGAGGIELAARLAAARMHGVEIRLVDREPAHVWKPRLHEVAVGSLSRDEIGYREHGYKNGYEFVQGSVSAVETARRSLTLEPLRSGRMGEVLRPEQALSYDTLVLALGSKVNDFGVPGVLDHCHCLDGPADAAALHEVLVEATQRPDPHLRVAIVGAGATGVELAAELHYAFNLLGRFGIGGRLRTTLVDRAPRVMPMLDPKGSARIEAWLRAAGVDLVLSSSVSSVEARAVRLADGRTLESDLTVWASGVIGPDLVAAIPGLAVAKNRRVEVDEHLRCRGVDDLFALGDCAAARDRVGTLLPPTAQVAHQQARYLAWALPRMLARGTPSPFRFRPKGVLINLGHDDAVGELGTRHVGIGGALPRLAYAGLEQAHRATLYGGPRALGLWLSDRLRGLTLPPLKLH